MWDQWQEEEEAPVYYYEPQDGASGGSNVAQTCHSRKSHVVKPPLTKEQEADRILIKPLGD
jgi:hypothetical protein